MENAIIKENRKCEQRPILSENGRVLYTVIANCKLEENFMTENELKFFYPLLDVARELQDKYSFGHLTIFSQVAVNRIVTMNNERIKAQISHELAYCSVDFVIYDLTNTKVVCAIELDDELNHSNNITKIERDYAIDHMFKGVLPLVRIPAKGRADWYTSDYIMQYLKLYKVIPGES